MWRFPQTDIPWYPRASRDTQDASLEYCFVSLHHLIDGYSFPGCRWVRRGCCAMQRGGGGVLIGVHQHCSRWETFPLAVRYNWVRCCRGFASWESLLNLVGMGRGAISGMDGTPRGQRPKAPSHQASASTDGYVPQHFRRHAMPTLSVHKPITYTHGRHWRRTLRWTNVTLTLTFGVNGPQCTPTHFDFVCVSFTSVN